MKDEIFENRIEPHGMPYQKSSDVLFPSHHHYPAHPGLYRFVFSLGLDKTPADKPGLSDSDVVSVAPVHDAVGSSCGMRLRVLD